MDRKSLWLALALVPLCAAGAQGALAATPPASTAAGTLGCTMTYSMTGWSVIYHAANGKGTITCNNGQTVHVNLSATGAGLTVGKYKITDGHGNFTGVSNVNDIPGTYGMVVAHAGAVQSSRAVAMTKGGITLTLTGTGSGWNIGAGFTGFTIRKAK